MTNLLTSMQMRALEQAAIASGDVTGLALMERAGQGVVAAIFDKWPDPDPDVAPIGGQPPNPRDISALKKEWRCAVVLCGPGNNGGDGFVVARLLHNAGWVVQVFMYGDPSNLPQDARQNHDRWQAIGAVRPLEEFTSEQWVAEPVVIDALFGTGLSRALPNTVRDVLMATMNCLRVAVDIPSILSADTGSAETDLPFPAAHLTVTFHRRKLGHILGDGPFHCGIVDVVDIGLPQQSHLGVAEVEVAPADLRKGQGHKYDHGHALVLSGGVGKGGAARLAAYSALRVGAGAVTVVCPPAALIENAAQLNAVMLQPLTDANGLAEVLGDQRIRALCIGPGLGTNSREAALLAESLGGEKPRPTVLDADALTLLAADERLFAMLHKTCVLTPHAGEFARLFPDLAEKLAAPTAKGQAYSKVDATRDAANRAGCVVLFKGPDTVIADPSGRCSINASVYDRATPWLATAGSGDVLAGLIAGLLARGLDPMKAAETGAWLHTECALSFGPGLIAEDLPAELSKVFRSLGV